MVDLLNAKGLDEIDLGGKGFWKKMGLVILTGKSSWQRKL